MEFVDAVHGKQGEALTLANGKTEKISFKWNLRPYLVVSKEGFLPTTTVSYAILPRQTTKAKVVLRTTADLEDLKCDAENKLCVGLVGILSNDRTRRAVSSLTSNKGYVLLFEIVAGSDLNNVESVVRTGFEEELTAAESLVVIERPVAALASAVKFDTYDASDNYADLTKTASVLGFVPTIDFATGIRRFTEWVNCQDVMPDRYDQSILEMKVKGLYR